MAKRPEFELSLEALNDIRNQFEIISNKFYDDLLEAKIDILDALSKNNATIYPFELNNNIYNIDAVSPDDKYNLVGIINNAIVKIILSDNYVKPKLLVKKDWQPLEKKKKPFPLGPYTFNPDRYEKLADYYIKLTSK